MAKNSGSQNVHLQVLQSMLKQEKVLFAPKNSSQLKVQYPELAEISEFQELNEYEMLFVWGYACDTSPFLDAKVVPEKERLNAVIEWAYPSTEARLAKKREFNSDLPAMVKMAIIKMKAFNKQARIEEQVFLLQLRENCKRFIAQDIETISPEEQDKYWVNVQRARKELVETRHAVEKGALGLADSEETFVPRIRRDLIALYHKRKR